MKAILYLLMVVVLLGSANAFSIFQNTPQFNVIKQSGGEGYFDNVNVQGNLTVGNNAYILGDLYYYDDIINLISNKTVIDTVDVNATNGYFSDTVIARHINATQRLTTSYGFGLYSNYSTGAFAQVLYIGTGTFGATSGTANVNIFGSSLNGVQLGTSSAGISTSGVSPNQNKTYFTNGGLNRMIIDTEGNVGIGTTNPQVILDVIQSQNSNSQIRVNNSNSGTSARATIGAVSTSGSITLQSIGELSTVVPAWQNSSVLVTSSKNLWISSTNLNNPNIIFQLNTSASTGEKMRLTSEGNLGIGTTNPTSKLEIVGNANITGFIITNLTSITNVTVGYNVNSQRFVATYPSSYVSNAVSDETGSGALVFGTSPTLATAVISSYIRGGTTNTSNLTLITTSAQSPQGRIRFGFGSAGTYFPVVITNRSIGIGTTEPVDNLHIATSNQQIRIEDIDDKNFTQLSYSTDQLIIRMNTISGDGVLTVTDSNKVGVNITASIEPTQTFTVQGTANITNQAYFGKNQTLISPNGTSFNCGVSNTGTWSCS